MGGSAIEELLRDPPSLHSERDFRPNAPDRLVSWGIQASFLKFVNEAVDANSYSLETGSGISTISFAIAGSNHICVSPGLLEQERIRAYCNEHGIGISGVHFVAKKSEDYLPVLDLGKQGLDFGLIDGSHAFPIPIIDYYFINRNLKRGGILAVDDVAIPSVGIIHQFLTTEPAYRFLRLDASKTGIYEKIAETKYPNDWLDQAFNQSESELSGLPLGVKLRERLSRFPPLKTIYRAAKRIRFPP